MADAKASTFSKITPVLTDYLMALDDPGGSPANANVEITDLLALLKTTLDTYYYGVSNIAYVTANFESAADTTLNNITGLSHTTANGGKYIFEAVLFISNDAAAGTKTAISGTTTVTSIRLRTEFMGAAYVCTSSGTLDEAEGSTAKHEMIRITGYIDVDAGGTLTVQAAQNVSNATATIVLPGSYFRVMKIA